MSDAAMAHGEASTRPPPQSRHVAARWAVGTLLVVAAAVGLRGVVGDPASWEALGPLSLLGTAGVGLLAWGRVRIRSALALALALRALLATAPGGVLSDDLYRYLWDGRVAASGRSPYADVPSAPALVSLRDDRGTLAPPLRGSGATVYERLNSPNYHSVYPTASQGVFRVAAAAEKGLGTQGGLEALRGLGALLELAALLLLARVAPTGGAFALYALHPLVLVEAGQGHTELYALPLLVAAMLALQRGRGAAAAAALAVAGAVKLVPLGLVPFALAGRSRREQAAGVAVAAAVGAVLLAPMLPHRAGIGASLALYASHFEFNAPVYEALKDALGRRLGGDTGPLAARWLTGAFVGACAGWLAWTYRANRPLLPTKLLRVLVLVYAGFVAASPTVHPWYLLPPLVLAAGAASPLAASLAFLAAASMGTYEAYTGGASGLWSVAGWAGAGVLAAAAYAPALLQHVLRRRARAKAARLGAGQGTVGVRVLDLGCGEGYVGEALAAAGAHVVLADIADFRPRKRTLPFVRVQGGAPLPFARDAFDRVVLAYVLHHAQDAEAVLAEALRVGKEVWVLESVYDTDADRRLLERLDKAANRLRSPLMRAQEEHLAFRRPEAWVAAARAAAPGARVEAERFGRWPHKQLALRIYKPLLPTSEKRVRK